MMARAFGPGTGVSRLGSLLTSLFTSGFTSGRTDSMVFMTRLLQLRVATDRVRFGIQSKELSRSRKEKGGRSRGWGTAWQSLQPEDSTKSLQLQDMFEHLNHRYYKLT